MQLVADDLLCITCSSYVHPFLDVCPACGTGRTRRFAEVIAGGSGGAIGATALVQDETTLRAAYAGSLAYSLRSTSLTSARDLAEAFGLVAESMTYRAKVAGEGPMAALPTGAGVADTASLSLIGPLVTVRALPSDRAIAEIPLESVLAATPIARNLPSRTAWSGATLGSHRVATQRLVEGDLLLTFAGSGTWGQVAIGNRRGLLAPSARADHFSILARWIAILAAAAAEARWQAVGPASYAAELGLGDPVASTTGAAEAGRAAGADGPGPAGGAEAPSPVGERAGAAPLGVRAALEQLEELRQAGLVSDEEYGVKRNEILSRL